MQIGPYQLPNNIILAPMAGITDNPFRRLCSQFGAGLTISEMVISNSGLQHHPRTLQKTDYSGENGLRSVQILGTEPRQMAAAARLNQDRGAQIIDINMGCPAKKVCSVAAGSALLNLISKGFPPMAEKLGKQAYTGNKSYLGGASCP